MMLEEDAGYNPFVEGESGGHGNAEHATRDTTRDSLSFLEGEALNTFRRNLSFLEERSSSSPSILLSPSLSSSNHVNNNHSPSFSSSPALTHSPSLRSHHMSMNLPPLVISSTTDEKNDDHDAMENPFVNDHTTVSSDDHFSSTPETSPSLLPSLSLPSSSSPMIRVSTNERLSPSPLLIPRRGSIPSSPRLPTSPLASSSSIQSPKGDFQSSSLFTYQSPPISRAVVNIEKADWVPDTYSVIKRRHSLVCEHCGDEFTFLRRRHHCRVCGHLYCAECIVKTTLPAGLGFATAQKTCVKCAYKVICTRGNFCSTFRDPDGLSIGQRISGKMQNIVHRVSGMHLDGKFDRFTATMAASRQFSIYHTQEMDLRIMSHDAEYFTSKAYIPKGDGPYSILAYIPGGNFVLDTDAAISTFCKELCCKVGCIVVCIRYRLAPENLYPTPWEDCYHAVKWLYESAYLDLVKLEKEPKIAVCGEGSGGLLAAAVCQMARDRGSPPISYQLLITPWLNLTTLNLDKLETTYVVTKDLMKWVQKQVFKHAGEYDKQYVNPNLSTSFSNLPPTKIITAGHDPLRNDAEEYANELRKADVSVSVTRYENSLHGFVSNYSDELEECVYECVVCLREVFGRGEPVGAIGVVGGQRELREVQR